MYANDPIYQDPRLQAFKDPAYQNAAGSKTIPPYASTRTDEFYSQLEPPQNTTANGAAPAQPSGIFGSGLSRWQNWVILSGCLMVLILMCTCGALLWALDYTRPELLYQFFQ